MFASVERVLLAGDFAEVRVEIAPLVIQPRHQAG
jgi:hypothetical protein